MLNMNYINSTIKYAVNFKTITSNIVEIKGDFPIQTDGIQISRDKKPDDIWDYSDYTTVYRVIEGGVQFSNDGSVYVEPIPVVNFYTDIGGVLDGAVMQEASVYEDLIVPTPIPNENYEFTGWSPEIPLSGEIAGDTSFSAIFTSTLPQPDLEPTLEERVEAVEEQNAVIEACLLEMSEVVYA